MNGELDPRKLKAGDNITLNLSGKNYTFEIEKDGEFTCKVQGKDDSVHIYIYKNKFSQEYVCMDYRQKKRECNIYFTHRRKIALEKYNNIIQK